MGIGVPLVGLLTVSQFRAVLAHEFGHYHAGDTKLGPWVYKTRAAILRTVTSLARRESVVLLLFNWYANMFLRVTLAISRAQEYAADRMAAQLEGSKALIDGLKQIHIGAAAWPAYFDTEVAPVLSAGFAPPLSQGFNHFLHAVHGQAALALAEELAEGKADKFDSHPALAERIAAVQSLPAIREEDHRAAIELLDNANAADCNLFLTDPSFTLRALTWEQVVEDFYVPKWREEVERQVTAIADMTALDLADQLSQGHFCRRWKRPDGVWPTDVERAQQANAAAAFALSLALMREGWTLHALPGESYLEKNGLRLEPFALTPKLASGEITANDWRIQCEQAGIIGLHLIAKTAASAP